jgi:outer membrane protein TolC
MVLPLVALAAVSHAETLEDAWQTALASHRQIAAATASRDAAGYELEQAKSARLPQLGLSSAYTKLDKAPGFAFGNIITDPIFDGDDFVTAGAQVSLPVYAGGGINAGIEAAEFGADAADGQLATVIQDIRLGVAEHYVAVLRAESAVTVAESYVASLETHTADTRNRFEIGDVPQNDYLAASVTLADAEQRLLQAQNMLDYARSAYNRLLGRPLATPVSVDPTVSIDGLLPKGAGLEELITIARENRHELAALGSRSQALQRQADRARAAARPQLALTGGYMYLENQFLTEDQFWMAGVAFQWNLFDGGQARKQSASLEQKAIAVDHNRADLESQIALQVRRAWNDRIEAERRLVVAGRTVEQAVENLRVVGERYEAGASRNVEVLDAAALREQALSNRDDARYGVALAKLRLARAVGVL